MTLPKRLKIKSPSVLSPASLSRKPGLRRLKQAVVRGVLRT